MKARKIYIVCGGGILSGREAACIALGEGLRQHNADVEYLTSAWGNGDFTARLRAKGFKCHFLRLGFISISLSWKPIVMTLDQLQYLYSLLKGYRRLLRANKPDVVIHTNWHHALLLAPLLNKARDIYWSHEVVLPRRHYRWIFRAIGSRVSKIVCVSHAVARSIEQAGVPSAKIITVHNGVEIDPDISRPSGRAPLRFGIVGQIAPWKGHEDLFDALALLRKRTLSLKIFGSGSSQYTEALKQKAASLQIADRIDWCGFVPKLENIYKEIDVCVMPSHVPESFGLAAAEANLSGRPVICTAVGALPELIEDRKTGLLVEPSRPDMIASAIDFFNLHPEQVQIMGEAGRRRMLAEFSSSQFVSKFNAVVEMICSPPLRETCVR